jgi:hypothetical protein
MRRSGTRGVADAMIGLIGYQQAVAFVMALRQQGFTRPYVPALATLRHAELRRLPATCDTSATAARLGMKAATLRRYLRRREVR